MERAANVEGSLRRLRLRVYSHRVMVRRLRHGGTILSAVLCLLTIALWVRGYWGCVVVAYSPPAGWESLDSRRGRGSFRVFRPPFAAEELKDNPEESGFRFSRGKV